MNSMLLNGILFAVRFSVWKDTVQNMWCNYTQCTECNFDWVELESASSHACLFHKQTGALKDKMLNVESLEDYLKVEDLAYLKGFINIVIIED